jgi:hypothetical protein
MLGKILLKDEYERYAEIAAWCSAHGAMLEDYGVYFMVVPRPSYEVTREDQLNDLMRKMDTIKKAYQGAQLMGTDTTQLQKEYKEIVDKIKRLQKEGVTIAD